jgi:hypothetical protein
VKNRWLKKFNSRSPAGSRSRRGQPRDSPKLEDAPAEPPATTTAPPAPPPRPPPKSGIFEENPLPHDNFFAARDFFAWGSDEGAAFPSPWDLYWS